MVLLHAGDNGMLSEGDDTDYAEDYPHDVRATLAMASTLMFISCTHRLLDPYLATADMIFKQGLRPMLRIRRNAGKIGSSCCRVGEYGALQFIAN